MMLGQLPTTLEHTTCGQYDDQLLDLRNCDKVIKQISLNISTTLPWLTGFWFPDEAGCEEGAFWTDAAADCIGAPTAATEPHFILLDLRQVPSGLWVPCVINRFFNALTDLMEGKQQRLYDQGNILFFIAEFGSVMNYYHVRP